MDTTVKILLRSMGFFLLAKPFITAEDKPSPLIGVPFLGRKVSNLDTYQLFSWNVGTY